MYKIAVLKFGGHALTEKKGLETLIHNIKYLKKLNYRIVICHGGTPSVDEKLKKENIKSEFVNGFRVTTKEIMGIVEEAILGHEVLEITKKINLHNLSAVSICGKDGFFIRCHKKQDKDFDYGYVGTIYDINTELIDIMLEHDFIPVISPIGCDDLGNSYNINSDYLASEIAKKLSADILINITNVDGVYEDINKPETIVNILDEKKKEAMYKKGQILPSMQTKIDAMFAYTLTTKNISYIIGSDQKISYDLFSKNVGTKIIPDKYMIRLALKEDIPNIIKMSKESFKQYQDIISYRIGPMVESKDDIYLDILNKYVFVLYQDGTIVGSARVKFINEYAKVSRMCINTKYKKNGYGTVLLEHIEHFIYQKGINIIGLTTLSNVPYLDNFYKKNNYIKAITNTSRGYERAVMIKGLGNNIDKINHGIFIKE